MTNRLDQESAQEIRWFFGEAGGQLGIKAVNWEPRGGRSSDTENVVPAEAAKKYNRINATLEEIGRRKTRVLQRFYADATWRGLEAFGVMAGLAPITEQAKYGYRKDQAGIQGRLIHGAFMAWLRALSARTMPGMRAAEDDGRIKAAIHGECERLMRDACSAYEAQKYLQKVQAKASARAVTHMLIAEARVRKDRPADWRDHNDDD